MLAVVVVLVPAGLVCGGDDQEVRGFVDSYLAAHNSSDFESLLGHFGEGADVVSVINGRVQRDLRGIREDLKSFDREDLQETLTLETAEWTPIGDTHVLVFAICNVHSEHSPNDSKLAISWLLTKETGSWRILHQHASSH